MKISIRLSLYSILITTIAIVLCCGILLITTANNHIHSAIDNGVAELRMLNNAFNAEMKVVAEDALSDTAQRSLVLYVFRKYTSASVSGAHYILADAEDTLYNDCPIDPRALLPDLKKDDGRETALPNAIAELDGRRYLVVGYRSAFLGVAMNWEYELYLVRDVTGVYDGVTSLGIRFAIIALITVIVSAVMMMWLIRRMLKPLGGLQKNAAALASGQYDSRITVRGHDEISALAGSFNKMADAISSHIEALEDTAEQRKLLLSALTHELKTPMTAIIGYSESLMRVNLNPKQKDESIAYIHKECRRIERLAQKMMRLIMLHGGEAPELSPQPVSALYAAVANTLNEVAEKENIRLIFENRSACAFNMDVDMMASVLINLFDNARKAGAKHISIVAKDNRISVIDDGAGIPADEIKKITQPFYMVDQSHSRSSGGSGLGLALCELIIKAHHARLSIDSRLGKGTTVGISFENPQEFTF